MRKTALLLVFALLLGLAGCSSTDHAPIAATTLPVYEFTLALCQGTGLEVCRLVTESVSCLHDYTLQVSQMCSIEAAQVVILSGAGLEEFLEDALTGAQEIVDASQGISLLPGGHHHDHDHEHDHDHDHDSHEAESGDHQPQDDISYDSHIWLSPANAMVMAQNICQGLCDQFPQNADTFRANLKPLLERLEALRRYGEESLAELSCRELITFHDGFTYLADAFHLDIWEAVEEESGSEASAAELISLIEILRDHDLPAVFTETNGSDAAARILAAETGAGLFQLDMAMAGDSYFDAMYRNIDTLKEAFQ